jgi:hypothetical protein
MPILALGKFDRSQVRPSWYGESVGHYEGKDTLVVDTIGISTKTFIDNYRTPNTDQLHVVERLRLESGGEMRYRLGSGSLQQFQPRVGGLTRRSKSDGRMLW